MYCGALVDEQRYCRQTRAQVTLRKCDHKSMKSKKRYLYASVSILGVAFLMGFVFTTLSGPRCPIDVKVRVEVVAIRDSLKAYYSDNGQLPVSLNNLIPNYLYRIPVDPWGNEYTYVRGENRAIVLTEDMTKDGELIYEVVRLVSE